jgi:thiol-disulfide isomerase/thioredoxin
MKKVTILVSLILIVIMAACTPGLVETPTSTQMPEPAVVNTQVTTTDLGTKPEWLDYRLVDVASGESFSVGDYSGKVVVIELMAMWCTTCMAQQAALKSTLDSLGNPDDIVTIVVDVDSNEKAEDLLAYTQKYALPWKYAVVTPEFARAISNTYGALYIQPPAAPMLIVDRDGGVHALTVGYKNVVALLAMINPFLDS